MQIDPNKKIKSFGRKYQDVSENEHFLEVLSVDVVGSENLRQVSCFFSGFHKIFISHNL